MKTILAALVATAGLVTLAGCAKPPSQIAASYVDPATYSNKSCDELLVAAQSYAAQARSAVGTQQQKADTDAVLTGVGLVIAWPALLFTSRDSSGEAAISYMRGHMNAIEIAAQQKHCPFTIEKV